MDITVEFDRMGPRGEALATTEGYVVTVPYAAPGDRAVVRIVGARGAVLRGRLVHLERVSPRAVRPRCHHFGLCGGCQWQHLDYAVQLEQKTSFVADVLADAGFADVRVEPAIGWEPGWGYRTQLDVYPHLREGEPILGLHARGGDRIVKLRECPISQPALVGALERLQTGCRALLALPLHGAVVIRRIRIRVAASSDDVAVGVVVSAPLAQEDRAAVVALLRGYQIPGLISIMAVVEPRAPQGVQMPADLLWGRAYLREEVLGVRYRVPFAANFPVNPLAFPGLLDLVLTQASPCPGDTMLELDAGIGTFTFHLASAVERIIAVTEGRDLDVAWEHASCVGVSNVTFVVDTEESLWYDTIGTHPVRLAFLHPPGRGLAPGVAGILRNFGVRRVVYLGRALGTLAHDASALTEAGFPVVRAQPVDLHPQTSFTHVLLTCVAS